MEWLTVDLDNPGCFHESLTVRGACGVCNLCGEPVALTDGEWVPVAQ